MKNTTHLLFWEIMGFIHRSFYQDISFQLQCISTRQVCSSVFKWTILEYWFSSFLICFKALPIKILQRGFLIRKHFNSTCIPGANSTFFRTFFNTYILCRLIHYYHFFPIIYQWENQTLLFKGLKLTIMLWNMPLLIDASVNLDLFVQCPSQRCEGAQQYRAWLNLLTRTTSALSKKPMWDWTRVFDDRSWFEIYLNYMFRT